MERGKRKGRQYKRDTKNARQSDTAISAAQISSPGENQMTSDGSLGNISLPGSSSGEVIDFVAISGESFIDAQPSTSSAQSVINSPNADSGGGIREDFSNRRQITTGLPTKVAPGNHGRKIRLVSNLFPVSLLPDGNIFHYDVRVVKWKVDELSDLGEEDDKNKRNHVSNTKLNREVIQNMLDNDVHFSNSHAVYDGKYNLYSPSPLQLEYPFETKVFLENENRNPEQMRVFKVFIKPVEKKNAHREKEKNCAINLSVLHALYEGKIMPDIDEIQEALVALETIFRHSPALRYFPIGRNFYHPDIGGMHPLSGGIQIWHGYHQSQRLGQWKLMVNLNTSATTFFKKQTLIEYLVANSHDIRRELPDSAIKKLACELRNVKIETYHRGYKARQCIIDMTKESAGRKEIEIVTATGHRRFVTISQYFRNTYNINLAYPHLPCVQVKPEKRKIYLPLELCNIPEGEHSKKELPIDDKRKMIQNTAHPPVTKFNKIMNIRNRWADYNNDEYLSSFNIKVDSEPVSLDGRVLAAPTLTYSGGKTIQPTTGSWNIRGLKFYEGVSIRAWCLLSLAPERWCNYRDLENFSSALQRIGRAAGLNIAQPSDIRIIDGRWYEMLHKILTDYRQGQIKLIVVVIPNKDETLYGIVKQIAEVELGLLTQCIDHNNAKKCNASTLSNLCLKINTKMGGINHTLTHSEIPLIMGKPVIIMGADVCHAGIADITGISVASVTGSLDMILSRSAAVCRLQKNEKSQKKSVEVILDLKDMVMILLKAFYRHTGGKKPEKIIFFRDGVSDTQFGTIRDKEMRAIRDACLDLGKNNEYQPPITFLTVQKRHHVRLIPENSRDGVGAEGNIPPGTVVDTNIVHPIHNDFYLCSHLGLKGTSKPAHYTVLHDDNEFTANDLQKLIYFSCNVSPRCSKSISIPVPVHHADLAAYRTRKRLKLLPQELKIKQSKTTVILKEILQATELADVIKNTMYFV